MLQYCGTITLLKGLGEEMVHRSQRGGLSGMATPHRSLALLEGYGQPTCPVGKEHRTPGVNDPQPLSFPLKYHQQLCSAESNQKGTYFYSTCESDAQSRMRGKRKVPGRASIKTSPVPNSGGDNQSERHLVYGLVNRDTEWETGEPPGGSAPRINKKPLLISTLVIQ